MKWSFKITQAAGIDVYVHITFFLLLAYFGLAGYMNPVEGVSPAALAFKNIVFVLIVFFIVVLHELGHALAARRYGIQTRDITLYPIGGVARLERMPSDPWQELVVALAGPAVNVVLAAVLFTLLYATGELGATTDFLSLNGLLGVNIVLVIFNLIPAFPMDGGRVLRALLAMSMDYVRATRIAATIGQMMAVLFVFVVVTGIFNNPLLLFVALVVWLGAGEEANSVQTRSTLRGVPVMHGMIREFAALAPGDPLERAVEHIIAGWQTDFPVVENGAVVGILTRADLMTALASKGEWGRVSEAMVTDFKVVEATEMLDRAFERFQECACRTLPVLHQGNLVGLLTVENVGELIAIQNALGHPHGKR